MCNSCNSLGHSRSTSKTQPFKLLLLFLFESNSLGSIHLNPLAGRNLEIAETYRLFESKCILSFDFFLFYKIF